MGFTGAARFTRESAFGHVSDDFAMDDVECNGDEASIQECTYLPEDNCGSGEAAGVVCSTTDNNATTSPVNTGFQLFLVGGDRPNEGNIMVIRSDGVQGPMCDDTFVDDTANTGMKQANVVCRHLGYLGAVRFTRESEFGRVDAVFAMDDVHCQGNETRIEDCSFSPTDDCGADEGAGVVCFPDVALGSTQGPTTNSASSSSFMVRLVGGSSPNEGNLIVTRPDGFTGPVCDDTFIPESGMAQANVFCRALGYPEAASYTRESAFGSVDSNFAMDDVSCGGDELRLEECPFEEDDNCGPNEGAGVICQTDVTTQEAMTVSANASDYEVRLVGGNTPSEGNIIVTRPDGFTGPICDDTFVSPETMVTVNIVCRQLGYPGAARYTRESEFGPVSSDFAMDNLRCGERVTRLDDCSFVTSSDCGSSEGAGVVCQTADENVPASSTEGGSGAYVDDADFVTEGSGSGSGLGLVGDDEDNVGVEMGSTEATTRISLDDDIYIEENEIIVQTTPEFESGSESIRSSSAPTFTSAPNGETSDYYDDDGLPSDFYEETISPGNVQTTPRLDNVEDEDVDNSGPDSDYIQPASSSSPIYTEAPNDDNDGEPSEDEADLDGPIEPIPNANVSSINDDLADNVILDVA